MRALRIDIDDNRIQVYGMWGELSSRGNHVSFNEDQDLWVRVRDTNVLWSSPMTDTSPSGTYSSSNYDSGTYSSSSSRTTSTCTTSCPTSTPESSDSNNVAGSTSDDDIAGSHARCDDAAASTRDDDTAGSRVRCDDAESSRMSPDTSSCKGWVVHRTSCSFDPVESGYDVEYLGFVKGELLFVRPGLEEGWAYGCKVSLPQKAGWFPPVYVKREAYVTVDEAETWPWLLW